MLRPNDIIAVEEGSHCCFKRGLLMLLLVSWICCCFLCVTEEPANVDCAVHALFNSVLGPLGAVKFVVLHSVCVVFAAALHALEEGEGDCTVLWL